MDRESDAALQHDIDIVEEQMRDAEDGIRNSRLKRLSVTWAVIVFTIITVSALILGITVPVFNMNYLAPWVIPVVGVVLVGGWFAGVTYMIRRSTFERKLERKIARCRESRRNLLTRMTEAEDITILRQYHSGVLGDIEEYRKKASKYRRKHSFYQTVVIIGSIVTTSVTSASGQFEVLRWAAPIIAMAVGISAGMTGYFKHKDRSMNLQQAADAIEHEHTAAELGIERYKRDATEEGRRKALVDFAETVERLKDEQRKREQQLEQPPETERRQ